MTNYKIQNVLKLISHLIQISSYLFLKQLTKKYKYITIIWFVYFFLINILVKTYCAIYGVIIKCKLKCDLRSEVLVIYKQYWNRKK